MTVEERFWSKVDCSGTCWLWKGTRNPGGYGTFRVDGRTIGAHRFAFMSRRGPIPPDRQLDHLCRVRHCVNPAHLEIVTKAENTRRGISPSAVNGRKALCPRGHALVNGNLVTRHNGFRDCLICRRQRDQRFYERKKERILARHRRRRRQRTQTPHECRATKANAYRCAFCRKVLHKKAATEPTP